LTTRSLSYETDDDAVLDIAAAKRPQPRIERGTSPILKEVDSWIRKPEGRIIPLNHRGNVIMNHGGKCGVARTYSSNKMPAAERIEAAGKQDRKDTIEGSLLILDNYLQQFDPDVD
jgi:hypothetical protein